MECEYVVCGCVECRLVSGMMGGWVAGCVGTWVDGWVISKCLGDI